MTWQKSINEKSILLPCAKCEELTKCPKGVSMKCKKCGAILQVSHDLIKATERRITVKSALKKEKEKELK